MPTRLTKAGWWYIGASTLTSFAAYHSASNVLFLALAFLMSALLLNGLLSGWNYSKLQFKNIHVSKGRAGDDTSICFEITDSKKAMHSMGMVAVIEITHSHLREPVRIKKLIRYQNHTEQSATVHLSWRPTHRGFHTIRLKQIESYFPFGLLLKIYYQKLSYEAMIWPKRIDAHQWITINTNAIGSDPETSHPNSKNSPLAASAEISGIRNYRRGDPMRTFNWKKTAQLRRPIIMEAIPPDPPSPTIVQFDFSAKYFHSEEDLHTYCSKISSWIEEQWKMRQLEKIALHQQPPILVHDTHSFSIIMDQLSTIEAQTTELHETDKQPRLSVITPQSIDRTLTATRT